ncbi:MAG TPA: hypothetical protein PKC18_18100, partial [Lacipirellulaceae bacterium]|nr:hypothetical protein [Lacipirellulaceae bacterium]
MFDRNTLTLLAGCENKGAVFFPGVHPQTWFALYAAKRGGSTTTFRFTFGIDSIEKATRTIADSIELLADVIRELAPTTYAIPDIRDAAELSTSKKMLAAGPAFGNRGAGPPFRHYQSELHMGNNRDLFTTDSEGLPVYEGRMIDHFDHRAKTYASGHGNSAVWTARQFGEPGKAIVPQWRVLRHDIPAKLGDRCDRFRIGFGDVANPRNERSFTATLVPPGVICGHTVPTIVFEDGWEWAYLPWLAVANSFAMDAFARRKLSSPHMTFTVLDSLPFPRPEFSDSLVQEIAGLVLRLICTAPEMTPYWNQMASLGLVGSAEKQGVPPGALVKEEERQVARAYLDAYVARRVFCLADDELSRIMDSFDVLQRRDERAYGDFRTKRLILEAFESLGETFVPTTRQSDLPDRPPTAESAEDSVLAELTYPSTVFDRLVCTAALSAIEQAGPLSSMDHLDILAFVTHPVWCKAFLDQSSHTEFDAAMKGIADIVVGNSAPSIGWKQCRDYLELRQALSVDHGKTTQPISSGSELLAVKQSLPGAVDEAVGFAIKALHSLHALRQDLASASPAQRQIIDSFDKQHRELQLVA